MEYSNGVNEFIQSNHLNENPAITRLTNEKYVNLAPDRFLKATESTIYMYTRWAQLLYECGDSKSALSAFIHAEKMLDFLDSEDLSSRTRIIGGLAETAVALDQLDEKTQNLLMRALDNVEQIDNSRTKIYDQIYLVNLFMKLKYYDLAFELLIQIDKQRQLWREPNIYQKVYWLSQLAPVAPICSDIISFISSYIIDDQLSQTVILIWNSYLGDIKAVEELLIILENKPSGFLDYLVICKSIIPFLQTNSSSDITFERAWHISQQILSNDQQWLWLSEALAVTQPEKETLDRLLQTMKLKFAQIGEKEKIGLASQMAPSLAYLCNLDREWSLSVLQNGFYRQEPYHRSVILWAIEQFAPMLFHLAGTGIVIETWNKIKVVDKMFFASVT